MLPLFLHGFFNPFRSSGNACLEMHLVLALLVRYCAGSLACRLTGSLALAAAALFSRCLQVGLVDGLDVLHSKPSPKKFILIISQIRPIFKRSARERKKVYILTDNSPMLSSIVEDAFVED